jgi:hypothetical protein
VGDQMESCIFIGMTNIYILERNGIPFYVGKTRHIIRRKNKHYITHGHDITLEVIDTCDDDKEIWKFWECYYIDLFKSWGFELENKNNGGGGPTQYSEDFKQKMRKPRKEGTGDKISKTLKQRNHSKYYTDEVRQKMSIPQKGKPRFFTEEHIKNITKANLESKGKVVECYDLDDNLIHESTCLREAKIWLLEKKPNISKNVDKQIKDCCSGRQKTCHNFKFKYKQ